nr:hypothetical protein [Tanacetum cinerariifolium]
MPAARLTQDKTEARTDWWISSRAYFDGGIRQAERGGPSSFQMHPNNNSFFNIDTPTNWQTPMPSKPGLSNWQRQMPSHLATPFWKPVIPLHLGTYNWQSPIPSHMGNPNLQPPIGRHHDAAGLFDPIMLNLYTNVIIWEQPPSAVLPKKRGNKTKNNVKKSNLSPLNLGNALDDDIERDDDVMFLGAQFTVPFTFWKQLVPHLCMPDIESNTPVGWLSGEHINSWMELLIRNRPKMPCGQWPIRLQ